MRGFIGLTKRNILIFFKDKQSVIFSLLTSIIVLALYLLFLKGTFIDAMNDAVNGNTGLSELIKDSEINMLANLVLLTGIIGSAMITVPYNCLTTVVKDRENKKDYDVLSTPIKRWQVILSYFTAASLSSVILTGIILTVGILAIRLQGSIFLGATDILAAYGVAVLGSVSATALFMILVLCFNSTGASGAFFGILSAVSGFVIGAYVPISQFSGSIQTVCNIFPASHVTIILRNVLMNGILEHMNTSLGGLDKGMFVESIKNIFGFKAHLTNRDLNLEEMIAYVLCIIGISVIVQILIFSKTYKKK